MAYIFFFIWFWYVYQFMVFLMCISGCIWCWMWGQYSFGSPLWGTYLSCPKDLSVLHTSKTQNGTACSRNTVCKSKSDICFCVLVMCSSFSVHSVHGSITILPVYTYVHTYVHSYMSLFIFAEWFFYICW